MVVSAYFHGRMCHYKLERLSNGQFIGGDNRLYSSAADIVAVHYIEAGDFQGELAVMHVRCNVTM